MDTLLKLAIFASGLLSGGIVALKVIAPRTKTTVDDSILKRMEDLEALVQKLLPKA